VILRTTPDVILAMDDADVATVLAVLEESSSS
jgi:hypothetical protein